MSVAECEGGLQVGQKVPDFSAQALAGDGSFKEVKLSDYKGKWLVLFFYPLDFTFVCPTEIQAFNKHYNEFKKLNADIIAASTDSVYSHKAWTESSLGKIQFPILGDTNHKVAKTFGVLLSDKGIALRGTFIIDPNSILKSAVEIGRAHV